MSVKLLSGMTNVLRFPVERCARPTLELLRGMAPDVREVMNMAEAFGMERPPPDLRERADIATAEHTSQIRSRQAALNGRRCSARCSSP